MSAADHNNRPTNPTGRSFLSYRRMRLDEAKLLIQAQHELGIPTWQDVKDLDEGLIAYNLRSVLDDSNIANAILWLTPEVEQSNYIRIESSKILERSRKNDSFFVIPVAAGGLNLEQAKAIGSELLSYQDWKLSEVEYDPIQFQDAADIAKRVLELRIQAIHKTLPPSESLRMGLYTRNPPPEEYLPLNIDWSHQFRERKATSKAWNSHLLPALKTVADTLDRCAHGRRIVAHGACAIPAAVALGAAFLAPRGIKISWIQTKADLPDQEWSLGTPPVPSGFQSQTEGEDVNAKDLAVLVSVTDDVTTALKASRPKLPAFRAVVTISKSGNIKHDDLTEPGHATHLARTVFEAIRYACNEYSIGGKIHLFMAAPAGLAMLIGQLLNTLKLVQTYEFFRGEGPDTYRPAALLRPSF